MDMPIITIFTKMDLISEYNKKSLILNYKQSLLKLKLNKVPILMRNNDDIVLFSRNIQEKNIIPTFLISNTKWEGLNLLKGFLSMLPMNKLDGELRQIENEEFEVKNLILNNKIFNNIFFLIK